MRLSKKMKRWWWLELGKAFSLLFFSTKLSLHLSLFFSWQAHSVITRCAWAAELFHMCWVRQIKLVLVDKGSFTHRCMLGELGVQSATLSKSQTANQPVSKLISQPATQTPKAAAAACVAVGAAQDDNFFPSCHEDIPALGCIFLQYRSGASLSSSCWNANKKTNSFFQRN